MARRARPHRCRTSAAPKIMDTMLVRGCVLGCDGPRAAETDLGWHACHTCANRLAGILHEIVELWALLPEMIASGSLPSDTARGAPGPTPGSPARLGVIALRDERTTRVDDGDPHSVLAILASWAQAVQEERHLPQPPGRASVNGAARLLSANLGWLLAQPWVDECASELRELHAQLSAACGTLPRTIPIGRCPTPVDTGDGHHVRCGVPLRAALDADVIHCRGCDRAWRFTEWPQLAGRQARSGARLGGPATC
ncbi:hypothetical protein M8C13_06145 [Crossiella sp. SN42]|uniref:hypothetical protein n=1 Tax=Crossiella sp. SN42 TaxID=2944808 RepID=UPI00207D4441|nr:hypothetical protein [Crossiella sp. SN42]MCO1575340.1 hypothetical protein [Crossiella sp. SN42]